MTFWKMSYLTSFNPLTSLSFQGEIFPEELFS